MKTAAVRDVYDWLNQIAPFDTAESYDNAGLLLGSMSAPAERILVALDATPAVIDEAIAHQAQLIVTHHPLMFHAAKNLLEDDYEGHVIRTLIQHNISLIAAHTNLDQSPVYSGSAVLAELLHLQNVRQEGFIFLGDVPEGETTAGRLRQRIAQAENEYIYLYGDADTPIRTLAICGGAFDEGYLQARQLGAQAYLTGEIRHHNAIAAVGSGFVLFGGGHYGTEAVLVPKLAESAALGRRSEVHRRVSKAMLGTSVLMLPAMAFLVVLGPTLGAVLFRESSVGNYLAPLSVGVVLSCYQSVLSCSLNGVGHQPAAARNALISGAVELVIVFLTVGIPGVGLRGYVWAFLISALVGVVLGAVSLRRATGLRLPIFLWITAPGLAALLMGLCINLLFRVLLDQGCDGLPAALVCLAFGAVLYLSALYAQGLPVSQLFRLRRS